MVCFATSTLPRRLTPSRDHACQQPQWSLHQPPVNQPNLSSSKTRPSSLGQVLLSRPHLRSSPSRPSPSPTTSLSDRHNAKNSELNIAACHSQFETACARALDKHPEVVSWARNFRLGWTVPYLWEGTWHRYEPDFVARLFAGRDNEDAVHLIVECKGVPDDHTKVGGTPLIGVRQKWGKRSAKTSASWTVGRRNTTGCDE